MANIKIKNKKPYSYKITSTSSNDTITVSKSLAKKGAVINLDLSGIYNNAYYFVKYGNDLVICSYHGMNLSSTKGVVTTIKDYYNLVKYNDKLVSIKKSGSSDYSNYFDYINDNTVEAGGVNGKFHFGTKGKDLHDISVSGSYVYELGGNDNYLLWAQSTGSAGVEVYDYAGTDIYYIASLASDKKANALIHDYAGNDSYSIQDSAYATIYESSGNDNYNMSKFTNVNVYDNKGNDNYKIARNSSSASINPKFKIVDSDGKDVYDITGIYSSDSNPSTIEDIKGNDVYKIDSSKITSITDKGGNDKYSFYDSYTSNITTIVDSAGNDVYDFIYRSQYFNITDSKGNDKYNLNDSSNHNTITDGAGKDSYNINNCFDVAITDNSGADKYNLSYGDLITISDVEGNDKYNISDSNACSIVDGQDGSTKGGNDTYNLNHAYTSYDDDDFIIKDYAGKDTYNVLNHSEAQIYDYNTAAKTANDKYNVKDSWTSILDAAGADSYNLTESNGYIYDISGKDTYKISGSEYQIRDYSGNDTYTVSSYSNVSITDAGESSTLANSNDTYNIKDMTSTVKITDDGGAKDVLNIGSNKNNLVFMANYQFVSGSSDRVKDGTLFIFDRSSNGYIQINNFINLKSNNLAEVDYTNSKGDGYIETIKAGKTNLSSSVLNYISAYKNINDLGAQIAYWKAHTDLDGSYNSVSALLSSNNSNDIAKFMTMVATNL